MRLARLPGFLLFSLLIHAAWISAMPLPGQAVISPPKKQSIAITNIAIRQQSEKLASQPLLSPPEPQPSKTARSDAKQHKPVVTPTVVEPPSVSKVAMKPVVDVVPSTPQKSRVRQDKTKMLAESVASDQPAQSPVSEPDAVSDEPLEPPVVSEVIQMQGYQQKNLLDTPKEIADQGSSLDAGVPVNDLPEPLASLQAQPFSMPVEALPVVKEPRFRETPQPPAYPRSARRRGMTGEVLIRALLNANGDIQELAIVESSGYSVLDDAAVAAASAWAFLPYRRGGKATSAWVEMPIVFELN